MRRMHRGIGAAPSIPGAETNAYDFVQTADALAIVGEKFHDARIIPPGGAMVGEAMRVTETFTRLSAGEMLYGFTVQDPSLYARPWRGENLFVPAPGRLCEYACHEGAYGLPDILRIARGMEAGR